MAHLKSQQLTAIYLTKTYVLHYDTSLLFFRWCNVHNQSWNSWFWQTQCQTMTGRLVCCSVVRLLRPWQHDRWYSWSVNNRITTLDTLTPTNDKIWFNTNSRQVLVIGLTSQCLHPKKGKLLLIPIDGSWFSNLEIFNFFSTSFKRCKAFINSTGLESDKPKLCHLITEKTDSLEKADLQQLLLPWKEN